MCDNLSKYIKIYITGFRKCYGTQHPLLFMLDGKMELNKGEKRPGGL